MKPFDQWTDDVAKSVAQEDIEPTRNSEGGICEGCGGTSYVGDEECDECREHDCSCGKPGLPNYNDGSGWRYYCGGPHGGCCP